VKQDTSPAQQERYFERLRQLTPLERLQIVSRLNRGVRRMAMAGIRLRHPNANEDEVRVRLVVRLYGRAAAERLFGQVPADAE
jgi:hypothetical protein